MLTLPIFWLKNEISFFFALNKVGRSELISVMMAGRRRGFTLLYCSSLISLFAGYDVCLPGMFVGGDFREWFAKPFYVVLFKMWWRYLPMCYFDTCPNEKEDVG